MLEPDDAGQRFQEIQPRYFRPGVDPRDTTGVQLTGLASEIIFAPPLIALGSLNILITSACIASQVSGDA